jgi:hypothetical protein
MSGEADGRVQDTNAGRGAPSLRDGAPLVAVVEAAEPRQGDNPGVSNGPIQPLRPLHGADGVVAKDRRTTRMEL